ncbi:MAG TPA: hypothetical protein VMM14_05240 [Acidimicrobiia bacterium]|nr:hypothetical protein [Acidimicrobiia bacterium]
MRRYELAVLGDPIAHSRSPQIHRAMLGLSELEGEYVKIRANRATLESEVERLREGSWDGLNVTMPLKADAARLADSLSPRARRSGSVNTLMRDESGIYGESTDATVFADLVGSGRFDPRAAVLVLGTGGSAAAALSALGTEEHVYLAARDSQRADELASKLGGEVIAWGTAVAGALVINGTPLGMAGETLPEGLLEVASGLIDLPYGDLVTPAVERTRATHRIEVVDGHEFLLRQAMASFRLWTGVQVEYAALERALRKD